MVKPHFSRVASNIEFHNTINTPPSFGNQFFEVAELIPDFWLLSALINVKTAKDRFTSKLIVNSFSLTLSSVDRPTCSVRKVCFKIEGWSWNLSLLLLLGKLTLHPPPPNFQLGFRIQFSAIVHRTAVEWLLFFSQCFITSVFLRYQNRHNFDH